MNIVMKLIIVIIVDFLLIWLWVYNMDPDPSSSLLIIIFIPIVIVINFVIGGILAVLKNENAKIFFLNSIISGVIMYYLFIAGIDRHQNERIESWKFVLDNTTYTISHWKLDNTFIIDQCINPGLSRAYMDGQFVMKDEQILLLTDTSKYIIKGEYLYNFKNDNDSIKLVNIVR